jgi:hypothetical protein
MRMMGTWLVAAFLTVAGGAVYAGGPTEAHPCYGVADCKTRTSRQEFSKCIKANADEASQNTECAAFRKDKNAYMSKHGISGLDELFK